MDLKGYVMTSVKFDFDSLILNDAGLIPAIAQDAKSGEVLMMAWMNRAALKKTLDSGQVTYWSRSRKELWEKGLTSGHTQKLVSLQIDCDRDCILMQVDQTGAACHTNRRSCFYTTINDGSEKITMQPLKTNP